MRFRLGALLLFWQGAMASLSVLGCGTHRDDEIPQDLLDAIASAADDDAYPAGAKGSEIGDIAPNVCVTGWLNPRATAYEQSVAEEICFADFWDPGAESHRLLLVNTAANWCSACQVEYGGLDTRPSLSEEVNQRPELRILGTLFQDVARNPSTLDDAALWAKAFEVDFPFGIDPDFEMGAFADPLIQPFNLLLDTRTMEVVLKIQGDNPGQLWPAIDSLLESR